MTTLRQIKFIWDFYGEDAQETATHHARHLRTFFELNQIAYLIIDTAHNSENLTSVAFVVSEETNVDVIKHSLRPQRATVFES